MAQEKKGLIARMLEGKEKSEEYARSTLPTNRWQLFWDIFKGNFGKIFKVNLLILIFFLPIIAIFIFRVFFDQSNGMTYPFGANLAVGYPGIPFDYVRPHDVRRDRRRLVYRRDRACGRHVCHPQHGMDGGHFRRQRLLAGR